MNVKEIYEHVFVAGFSVFGSIVSLMYNRHETYTLFTILRRLTIGIGVGLSVYLFSFDHFNLSENQRFGAVLIGSILADDILMTLLNLTAQLKNDPIGLINQFRGMKKNGVEKNDEH